MSQRIRQEPLAMFESRDVEFNFAYHSKNHKYNRENDGAVYMLIFMGYAALFSMGATFMNVFVLPFPEFFGGVFLFQALAVIASIVLIYFLARVTFKPLQKRFIKKYAEGKAAEIEHFHRAAKEQGYVVSNFKSFRSEDITSIIFTDMETGVEYRIYACSFGYTLKTVLGVKGSLSHY